MVDISHQVGTLTVIETILISLFLVCYISYHFISADTLFICISFLSNTFSIKVHVSFSLSLELSFSLSPSEFHHLFLHLYVLFFFLLIFSFPELLLIYPLAMKPLYGTWRVVDNLCGIFFKNINQGFYLLKDFFFLLSTFINRLVRMSMINLQTSFDFILSKHATLTACTLRFSVSLLPLSFSEARHVGVKDKPV